MKTCSKCGEAKALGCFSTRKDSSDGRRGVCRKCDNARKGEWAEANKPRLMVKRRLTDKQRYAVSPDKIRLKQRIWRAKNLDRVRERERERYRNDREMHLERAARYRKRHATVMLQRTQEWRKAHREYVLAESRKHSRLITDQYVRILLGGGPSIPSDLIPKSLIEAKRVQLQIKRFLKEQVK